MNAIAQPMPHAAPEVTVEIEATLRMSGPATPEWLWGAYETAAQFADTAPSPQVRDSAEAARKKVLAELEANTEDAAESGVRKLRGMRAGSPAFARVVAAVLSMAHLNLERASRDVEEAQLAREKARETMNAATELGWPEASDPRS